MDWLYKSYDPEANEAKLPWYVHASLGALSALTLITFWFVMFHLSTIS